MTEENFDDFGFSFADDVTEEHETVKKEVEEIQKRMDKMHSVFNKFLDNLAKNPEQKTIVWPNRLDKINEFKILLTKIKKGEE